MAMGSEPRIESRPRKRVKLDIGNLSMDVTYPPSIGRWPEINDAIATTFATAVPDAYFLFYAADSLDSRNRNQRGPSLHEAYMNLQQPEIDPDMSEYYPFQKIMQQSVTDKSVTPTAMAAENMFRVSSKTTPNGPATVYFQELNSFVFRLNTQDKLLSFPTSLDTVAAVPSTTAAVPGFDLADTEGEQSPARAFDDSTPPSMSPNCVEHFSAMQRRGQILGSDHTMCINPSVLLQPNNSALERNVKDPTKKIRPGSAEYAIARYKMYLKGIPLSRGLSQMPSLPLASTRNPGPSAKTLSSTSPEESLLDRRQYVARMFPPSLGNEEDPDDEVPSSPAFYLEDVAYLERYAYFMIREGRFISGSTITSSGRAYAEA
ncbi:hypothetical protein ColLi_12899 [Colletotrichum liriopes]|uniref:Uncharacterized protein n=1 Tax=Colletotrichum liriopes TaxID=708192 RepID=A0AA37GZ74_9PEZI|nr:hypothetical protein ColLi_12899 [Colletotrichum liriopes]